MRTSAAIAPLLLLVVLAGCGSQRKAADAAMADAHVAYAGIRTQAENVAPDEAKLIQDALAQATDEFEKGNVGATLAAARTLRNRIEDLADRLPDKQAELDAAWANFDATLPGTLAALERKFGRGDRPSSGTGRGVSDDERMELRGLVVLWGEAQAAHQLGRIAEAVTKAGEVKYRALRLLEESPDGS